MHTFKTHITDGDGTSKEYCWTVAVSVITLKRVRDLAGVDLMGMVDGDLAAEIASDYEKLVNVLYAVIQPQAEAAGVTDIQFGESMIGDPLESATQALLESLLDFFPSRRRNLMRKIVDKRASLTEAVMDRVAKDLDSGEPEKRVERLLAGSGLVFTTPLASPASTPTPSP